MIHCDDVFDVLTRGPFPSGEASDNLVERHLADCAGCRRLAEALRPAIELFEEAIGPEESRHLPRYWGDAATDVVDACEAETRVAPPQVGLIVRARRDKILEIGRNAARFLAAVAVGIAIAAVFGQSRAHPPGGGSPSPAGGEYALDAILHGAKWSPDALPAACRQPPQQVAEAAKRDDSWHIATLLKQKCCTECHRSVDPGTSTSAATTTTLLACSTCHQNIE